MMSFFNRCISALTRPLRALLSPAKLFAPLGRLARISLPAKVAILLFIFLIIGVTFAIVANYLHTPTRAEFSLWNKYWLGIAILVLVIPVVVYYALRLWLEGEVSPYPDIDRAWKAGLAELHQQGIDLSQTPLFLVLGSAGEEQENALLTASRLSLNVVGIPHGPNPLHWYANPDAVYLILTQAGCLSRLAGEAKSKLDEQKLRGEPAGPPSPAGRVGGTMIMDGQQRMPPPSAGPVVGGAADLRGTMDISAMAGAEDGLDSGGEITVKRVVKLESQEAAEQDRRLQYLCRLVRRERQPLCPINGLVTLLPFGLIQRSAAEAIEVQRALKRDLASLLNVLALRCPTMALVVGMEEEVGFRELVDRVGPERAAGNRFGKGYSVSNPPLAERMEALCIHACGAFEDWVYFLFREKGALAQPGNTRLYSLLVKIRRNFQKRLADILAGGFGIDDEQGSQSEAFFFGGCYFAAVGNTEDRQAFVKSVFDKLPDQQEELQWTEAAIRQNQKVQQIANIVLALGTAILIFLAVILLREWIV